MKKILNLISKGMNVLGLAVYSLAIGVAMILGVLILGGMLVFAYVLFTVPKSDVIDENSEMLQVGEVWTVDDQFSLWIDSVEEVSIEEVKEHHTLMNGYDSTGKRCFDITFSFRNDNFEGFKTREQFNEYLRINTHIKADNAEGKGYIPDQYEEEPYQTTIKDGQEVLVEKGVLSTDNHVFVVLDEAEMAEMEQGYGEITHLNIRFLAPIEILSSEAAVQYAQNFYYPLPE